MAVRIARLVGQSESGEQFRAGQVPLAHRDEDPERRLVGPPDLVTCSLDLLTCSLDLLTCSLDLLTRTLDPVAVSVPPPVFTVPGGRAGSWLGM